MDMLFIQNIYAIYAKYKSKLIQNIYRIYTQNMHKICTLYTHTIKIEIRKFKETRLKTLKYPAFYYFIFNVYKFNYKYISVCVFELKFDYLQGCFCVFCHLFIYVNVYI